MRLRFENGTDERATESVSGTYAFNRAIDIMVR